MITISFAQMKQHHKIECPDVSLEFFMQQWCKQLALQENETIEVVVSSTFKFVFT
jgi:hypothetical protein